MLPHVSLAQLKAVPSRSISAINLLHNTILEACPIPQCATINISREASFDWEETATDSVVKLNTTELNNLIRTHENENKILPLVPAEVVATFLDEAICLATDVTDVGECMVLASKDNRIQDVYEFSTKNLQFAVDV